MSEQLSLMAVYAHPDDEQGVSGSLAKYARQGVNTTLICATRGEVGEIAPGVDATAENLGQVRESEMRCAAAKIGLRHLYFLDYRDSGMVGTADNEDKRSLHQASLMEVAGKVVRIVREQKPQVMVTFDAWGGYGHPDHIQMHKAAIMAFWMAGDARYFSEQLTGNLQPWTPLKLYYNVWTRSRFTGYLEYLQREGKEPPEWVANFGDRALPDDVITTRVEVADFAKLKLESLQCHASQLGPNTFFRQIPEELWLDMVKSETFMLAESRTGRATGETDLFQGLDKK
ncbi:MAG TPA: PIG-L family deacetylase [Anaerolineae bacterium]|nr:PIG-L family deacetylase [Anaerolineae bacterium]